MHNSKHTNSIRCSQCERRFTSTRAYARHVRHKPVQELDAVPDDVWLAHNSTTRIVSVFEYTLERELRKYVP